MKRVGWWREVALRLPLGLALAFTLAACADPAPDPARAAPAARVVAIEVTDATPPDRRPVIVGAARLHDTLRAALAAAGLAVDGDDLFGLGHAIEEARERAGLGPGGWRVEVTARAIYGVSDGEGIAAAPVAGQAKAMWLVDLRLRPPDGSPALYAAAQASAEAAFAGADAAALRPVIEARIDAAATDAARQVAAQVDTLGQPVERLIDSLRAAEPDIRRAAAGRLGMLRDATAVPALADQLRVERDREARLRMIGALAEIGDDRAAEVLIELANPRDRELLRAVVDALSVVGGPRVDDFLGVLATHDDADVRLLVEQARERLARPK